MSVWKRLANVAKGTVKEWQRDDPPYGADVERELTELERHPAPGERTTRRDPIDDRPAAPVTRRSNHAEEPVPRTDLFGEPEKASSEPAGASGSPPSDSEVKQGRGGRKL